MWFYWCSYNLLQWKKLIYRWQTWRIITWSKGKHTKNVLIGKKTFICGWNSQREGQVLHTSLEKHYWFLNYKSFQFFFYFFSSLFLWSPHKGIPLRNLVYIIGGAVIPLPSNFLWSFSTFQEKGPLAFLLTPLTNILLMFIIKKISVLKLHDFRVSWSTSVEPTKVNSIFKQKVGPLWNFSCGLHYAHTCADLARSMD